MKLNAHIRNLTFLLLIAATVFLFHCQGKRCMEDVTFCPLPETGEKYFSGYKEGSYWIYHNKDSTKRDSVYITDYSLQHIRDEQIECHEWDEQEMNINSEYLADTPMPCRYQNPNCEEAFFNLFNSNITVFFYSHAHIDSLYGISDNNSMITQINSFEIALSNDTYIDVVRYEVNYFHQKFWFAPEVGLLQYTSFNDQDTLYLTKFHRNEE